MARETAIDAQLPRRQGWARNPQIVALRKLFRIPQASFGIVVLALALVTFLRRIISRRSILKTWISAICWAASARSIGSAPTSLGETPSRVSSMAARSRSSSASARSGSAFCSVFAARAGVGVFPRLGRRFVDARDGCAHGLSEPLDRGGAGGDDGASLVTVILAIGIANVPWIARIVRSQGLSVREQDYVAAATAGGMGHLRIIAKHIFPNTLAPVIVQATLGIGYAVLTEAALGFIGVGVQPPTPTWGAMLQQAFPHLEKQPLMSIVPGFAIFMLVLAFNFIGDSLRDILIRGFAV